MSCHFSLVSLSDIDMLLLFTFVYFVRNTIQGAPLSPSILPAVDTPLTGTLPVQSICSQPSRSLLSIVWSCLATTFACTWLSVHPNILVPKVSVYPDTPAPESSSPLKVRMELMFYALTGPELIVWMALREWLGAQELVEKFPPEFKWTKMHAHLIQMGGFVLVKEEERRVLKFEEMLSLIKEGRIKFPEITEDEIKDRSKADALAKGLVILQTSWFLIQVIARHIQGLVITELELITTALAIFNGAMYILWWDKPLDIRWPFLVYYLDSPLPCEKRFLFTTDTPVESRGIWKRIRQIPESLYRIITRSVKKNWHRLISIINTSLRMLWMCVTLPVSNALWDRVTTTVGPTEGELTALYTYARDVVVLWKAALRSQKKGSKKEGEKKVTQSLRDLTILVPAVASVLFGVVHFFGWFFIFPLRSESILWRVSSLIILTLPFSAICVFWWIPIFIPTFSLPLVFKAVQYAGLIYLFARLIVIGEAFSLLGNLPEGAYEVVKWTTFIPHI